MNGPALLRRALLVLATTLIVARPLVIGEDPGLTANLADPWGMMLTFLWLLAAVGWAAWRFLLRPTLASGGRQPPVDYEANNWYGGIVQTALLMTVALVFVSAEAASYKFPARLIAWEWFGLFGAFFVVRQLAVTPSEQRGFFAVVLAGAVSLAAQGIYQELVEMPRNRRLAEDPEAFRKAWAAENPAQDTSESLLEQLRLRALQNNIYGPYAHPNSYAGFLVLGLPGLIGAVFLCRRMQAPDWQTILTAVCAVAALAALWLTHSRGALLGLALASVGVGLFLYRRTLRGHVLPVVLAMALLIGLIFAAWWSGVLTRGMGKSDNTIAQRLEYWRTTGQMIAEQPWLGVGPGNFGAAYQRLMPDNSEEKIKDPHNFALEMWATCGVFAVLVLLLTLGGFFARVANEIGRAGSVSDRRVPPVADAPGSSEELPEGRWDFYLGGMFGLLLGFVLRVNTMSPDSILSETLAAALRAVVWFAAFALLDRMAWSNRSRVVLLTTGIAALLLNLCVSGGIQFPSLAGPLWIAVALALNAASLQPTAWLSRPGASMILPLPIFLGVFLGYGVYILYPILASDSLVRDAVQAVAYFQGEAGKPAGQQALVVHNDPAGFVQRNILGRLEQARRLTPDDARIYVQLAWWSGVRWNLQRLQTQSADLPIAKRAIAYGMRAVELDPQGGAGYLIQYRLRVWFADILEKIALAAKKGHGDPLFIAEKEQDARNQYELAAEALEQYLPHDPHDAALRYALAHACFKAGDPVKGRAYAAKASQLDDLVTAPARKLTDRQRKQIDDWLGASPAR